jgi:hypothetical protein
MQTGIRPPFATHTRWRAAVGALALCLAAAACADRTATGPELRLPPDPAGTATTALDCRVDVRAGTLQCAPTGAAGGASAVVVGGQGTNVRLRSTSMTSDGAGTFRMDVTVENLLAQLLGTTDGVTPAAEGVRVFFMNGPTSPTGAVEVANPTGRAMFTAANQPYFQYQGLLAPGDTSEAVEWRFTVAPTVVTFQFQVLVAAPTPREQGWLRMEPFLASLAVGESMVFHAYPYDAAGRPLAAAPITWSSSDSTVARVAADGTVTGLSAGTAILSATDGVRTSRTLAVSVKVPAGGDVLFPTAHDVTLSARHMNADGADSVTISVRLTDRGTGTRYVYVGLISPSVRHKTSCYAFAPTSGTRADGTFSCRVAAAPRTEGGVWHVSDLHVQDLADRWISIQGTGPILNSSGVPAYVYVRSPTPDLQAPTFTNVAFTPDSVQANGLDSVTVTLRLQDAGSGVAYAYAAFINPAGNKVVSCETYAPSSGTAADGTFTCRLALPSGAEPGDWTLWSVDARDAAGGMRRMVTSTLLSAGYPTVLRVSGPPADTEPPSLTGFSFSPDTVAANGLDSVTVVMEISDTGSGMEWAQVTFASPSGQKVSCVRYGPSPRPLGTVEISCRVAIASGLETGTWRASVMLDDPHQNTRVYDAEDLEALGFPATLTVAAP